MTTTAPLLDIHQAIQAIAQMERHAATNGKKPFALSMAPKQWDHIVDYVTGACHLAKPPKEMEPLILGTLGNFHGLPVMRQTAAGIACHVA